MAWAPDYVTAAELKSYLRITDTADDAELALAITAASRAVDGHTHRQFGKVASAEERLYTAEWDRRRRRWVVTVDDVQDLTGLALEVTDVGTIDAYTFEPVNNDAKGKPFERLVVDPTSSARPTGADDEVAITALWGWSSVPVAVEEAAMLQAARFHARRFSPYGVAGSPDQGSEMRLLARLDADVTVALVGYRRWWAAA